MVDGKDGTEVVDLLVVAAAAAAVVVCDEIKFAKTEIMRTSSKREFGCRSGCMHVWTLDDTNETAIVGQGETVAKFVLQ
jgi:hypothetical protein